MNVLFFDSHTFIAREVGHALRSHPGIHVVTVTIPEKLPPATADEAFDQFKCHLPGMVISINEAGYDVEARLSRMVAATGSCQINWFLDDPFYEYTILKRCPPPLDRRIDFVTELSFVSQLRARGRRAFFLPLAADTRYFNNAGAVPYERDVAFVGNSSMEFIDSLINEETGRELERFGPLIARLRQMYEADPSVDLPRYLSENQHLWATSTTLDPERFVFTVVWLVGYFYRRDFISGIARRFGPRFTCFGDAYWTKFMEAAQVSANACYYTNLCRYYRSTRVNLNINRIQIRTSFTQRIFDCLASGGFLLTEKRELNQSYFATGGDNPELVEFESQAQCMSLIDYYLNHEEERESIARAGMAEVLREHTYDRRIEEMLRIARSEFGI